MKASRVPASPHKDTSPSHYCHSPLYPGLKSRPRGLFPFREERGAGSVPSHPPLLPQEPPTPQAAKYALIANKPGLSHTQDGSQTPTGGNSRATTPVKPASRLRLSPLAQRESARQRESAVSKSAGGALAPPRCRRLARGCLRRGPSALQLKGSGPGGVRLLPFRVRVW